MVSEELENTLRFMVSSLYDFNKEFDLEGLLFLDKVMVVKTYQFKKI